MSTDQHWHEQIGCYCESRTEEQPVDTNDAALAAANRIMHGDGSEDDVQLVAGVLFQILTSPRWKSEWRTGREWVPLP